MEALDYTSSSSDEEEFYWLTECYAIFMATLVSINSDEYFQPAELDTETQN